MMIYDDMYFEKFRSIFILCLYFLKMFLYCNFDFFLCFDCSYIDCVFVDDILLK